MTTIVNYNAENTVFYYGKAFEIVVGGSLNFYNNAFSNLTLTYQDLLVLNTVQNIDFFAVNFSGIQKNSQTELSSIMVPSLGLTANFSAHTFTDINQVNSQSAFLTIEGLTLSQGSSGSFFELDISNIGISNSQLQNYDNLFSLTSIVYSNFSAKFENITLTQNILSLGSVFYMSSNCESIVIQNSNVVGGFGVFLDMEPTSLDTSLPLTVYLEDTTLYQNNGNLDALMYLTTNAQLFVSRVNFTENYSYGRGSVVFVDFQASYASFDNCTFERNYAQNGGVFYAAYSSTVEITNSIINENFGVVGGVGYVNNDGSMKIWNNTVITLNQALNTCLFFLINTKTESILDMVSISQNDQQHQIIDKNIFLSINSDYKFFKSDFFTYLQTISTNVNRTINSNTDYSITAISGWISINNTQINDNEYLISASTTSTVSIQNTSIADIVSDGTMIQVVLSVVTLDNIQIQNVSHFNGEIGNYLFSIISNSTMSLSNSSINQITDQVLYMTDSLVSIQATNITNIFNDDLSNPMILIDSGNLLMDDVAFYNLSQSAVLTLIDLTSVTTNLNQINVSNYDKTFITASTSNMNFTNSQVTGFVQTNTSLVFESLALSLTTSSINISRSSFTNLQSQYSSPAISIINDLSVQDYMLLNISDSNFINNSAYQSAGVMLVQSTNLNVQGCIFQGNSALTGSAGVMDLSCPVTPGAGNCSYNISDSLFVNNSASINGGALTYDFYPPDVSVNNTFENNSATYANDIASYPAAILMPQGRRLQALSRAEVQALGLTDAIVYYIDTPQVSGNVISPSVSFDVLDITGVKIVTDNSSVATMVPLDSISVNLLKSKFVTAVDGTFVFNDVIIVSKPGTNVTIKISVDSIDKSKLQSAFPSNTIMDVYLLFNLRLCTRGEYQTSDNKCVVCSQGFYSLYVNDSSCHPCPLESQCQNGYQIIPNPGFWRQNVNATEIYACYNYDACLSSYEPSCAEGYGGNLCQSCVEVNGTWYSQTSANICTVCPPHNENSLKLFGLALLIFVYFVILLIINIRSIGQKITTVYMRILTNYFQILTLASDYNLSWQGSLSEFLYVISFLSKADQLIISQDCLIRESVKNLHPLFVKMAIAFFFPFVGIVAIVILWSLARLFKKNLEYKNYIVQSITIFVFVCIPPITTLTFEIFNCQDIFNNGQKYLIVDLDIQCWVGDHNLYAKLFGIPCLIIWVIGVPFFTFFMLYKKKTQLNEDFLQKKYGFLYIGLVQEAFYWEIILHLRKVGMISINIFFSSFLPLYRALIGFMVLVIYIEFLQKIAPYITDNINNLEFRSSIASFTTFYGGLFFINSGIPVPVTVFMFAIILVSNCVFWLSWIKLVFPNFSARIENYLMARVCCCFKKKTKKGSDFDRIEDESEYNKSAANDSQRDSGSIISGQKVRQLNINSENASVKNIQIADSAKKDLLSKQKTKSKLDKITKKKKRTGHVPMTTAVNDASKTIDESRIDLDQTYDESQKKGNRIKVVESDDSDSQSKKKVKNKIIAKKSSSNSNKTSMSPFVDTSLDKKMQLQTVSTQKKTTKVQSNLATSGMNVGSPTHKPDIQAKEAVHNQVLTGDFQQPVQVIENSKAKRKDRQYSQSNPSKQTGQDMGIGDLKDQRHGMIEELKQIEFSEDPTPNHKKSASKTRKNHPNPVGKVGDSQMTAFSGARVSKFKEVDYEKEGSTPNIYSVKSKKQKKKLTFQEDQATAQGHSPDDRSAAFNLSALNKQIQQNDEHTKDKLEFSSLSDLDLASVGKQKKPKLTAKK